MCLSTKIQQKIQQKAELDAQIAKLEKLEASTAPVKNLLIELLTDYSEAAPEDLATVWEEVLAIGQQHNLSVQPLAADELRQWEAVSAENERLRQENQETIRQYLELLETSANRVKELQAELGEVEELSDNRYQELQGLRSQLAQIQTPKFSNVNEELEYLAELRKEQLMVVEAWSKDTIAPGLEKLHQEAQAESDSIPALTLWQPWATLIQQEVKRIETRSWSTNYRGPIAIHAAKKPVGISDYPQLFELLPDDCEFPLGAVVAIANLVDCVEMTPEFIAQQSEQELKCGDWQPGRFAWVLEIIRPVVPPTPATGGQKLWNWSGTSVNTELEYLEKLKTTPEPEYEPDEVYDTVESILKANGFFQPDGDIPVDWDSSELYENYRGWDIFYSFPNGGIVAIGLNNSENNQFWDASTEYIQEIDKTFPESLADYDEIVAWTRALIDWVENLEVPGQLSLDFSAANEILESNPEPIAEETNTEPAKSETNFEAMGFNVQVYPQYGGGNFVAATFRFLNSEKVFIFDGSLLKAEIGDRNWKTCAYDLIQNYRDKEAARLERIANPYKKPEDDFIELVKLTPAVGYLKRRDNGELLAAYAAFANRNAAGEKTETLAKSRAKKWAEHFSGVAFEHFKWKAEEPRKIKRMTAELGARQQFAYEIKITGNLSIEQIQKLAENDFSLLPEEIGVSRAASSSPPVQAQPSSKIYSVKINSYETAQGTEAEMRSRFEEELKILGGSQMSVSLLVGSEVIESYRVSDFQFVRIDDFDTENPEYEVAHLPTQKFFKVYKRLGESPEPTGWTNSVYPYTPGFAKREAAAADAVRRLLKAQNAAE